MKLSLREISMEYCAKIRQSARTAFVIVASIISFQDHISQETRMNVLAESEDIIAMYANDVVSMNSQTTSAITSSLSAIDNLNSNSPDDPTKANMFL